MAEIKTSHGSLFFYTHWSGSELPGIAKQALNEAEPRIGDEPYALKIVVDALIRLTGLRDKETGAGLMLKPNAEDEYNHNKPSVLIDITKNKITVLRHSQGE